MAESPSNMEFRHPGTLILLPGELAILACRNLIYIRTTVWTVVQSGTLSGFGYARSMLRRCKITIFPVN